MKYFAIQQEETENRMESVKAGVPQRSNEEDFYSLINMTPTNAGRSAEHRKSERMNGKDCAICGDNASGRHYGVASCEGCKGFFKRSIRKKLSYPGCRKNGTCEVNKLTRNLCQSCRYAKCVKMGMKVALVQNARRSPGNSPTCQVVYLGSTIPGTASSGLTPPPGNHGEIQTFENIEGLSPAPVDCTLDGDDDLNAYEGVFGDNALVHTEYPIMSVPRPNSMTYDTADLISLVKQLLVNSIKWTKERTLFNALEFRIQREMILATWHEQFVIGLIQSQSLYLSVDALQAYCEQLSRDDNDSTVFFRMRTKLAKVETVLDLAVPLNLGSCEITTLKMLCLTSPMRYREYGADVFKAVTDAYLDFISNLANHVNLRFNGNCSTSNLYAARVLDILSQLRSLSATEIQEIYFPSFVWKSQGLGHESYDSFNAYLMKLIAD